MTFELKATSRAKQGTGASRRLRKAGQLPGIVYGGAADAVAINLDHNSMYYTLQDEKFHTALISLSVDGAAAEQVVVRAVQYHPFKQQVQHIDFQRVSAESVIELRIPLHFVGGDTCLGVKMQGGAISNVLKEVMVRCVASKLPEFITVDQSKLAVGNLSVHLSDIALPEGVQLVSLLRGSDLAVSMLNGAKG